MGLESVLEPSAAPRGPSRLELVVWGTGISSSNETGMHECTSPISRGNFAFKADDTSGTGKEHVVACACVARTKFWPRRIHSACCPSHVANSVDWAPGPHSCGSCGNFGSGYTGTSDDVLFPVPLGCMLRATVACWSSALRVRAESTP